MKTLAALKETRASKTDAMRAIVAKATSEHRELSEQEQSAFDAGRTELEHVEREIRNTEFLADAERRVVGERVVTGPEGGAGEAKSWGEQATAAPEIRSFIAGGYRGTARIELRAVQNLGTIVRPDRRPDIIGLPQRRLFLRDLLPVAQTTSSSIEFVKESSFTNNAAPVLEATGVGGVGVKPESDLALTTYTAPVRTIAHWLTTSRQAMDDLDQLRQFIDNRLRFGLAFVEETQLLSGNGVSPNIAGLIGAATAYDTARNVSGDKRLDVVHHAVAQLADSFIAASGIVLNLADWSKLLEQKDSTGQYLSQGPFGTIEYPRLWGVPVVATPALAAGTFLVADFQSAATIFDRMLQEVLVSSEHSDYFVRNLLAVRAEERIALAIRMPTALVTGSFGLITA